MRGALAAAVIAVLVATGGCSNSDETTSASASPSASPSESPSESPSAAATESESATPSPSPTDADDDAIEIEIEGDRIEPNGKRVKVNAGEPIRLEIESDRAGELHVHSTPEQTLTFARGDSTVELTIDTPGVVDVEEHEAHTVILQLEVR